MPRDRANIRTDIWTDDEFRALSGAAQLLYLQLLSAATLSYVGVADWRPKRLAALSAGRTAADVQAAADELVAGLFVVVDEDTEEVLVRSFLKHDGLLLKPNVTKAMLRDFGQVYSGTLRGVIVHELNRLRERFPEWRGFEVPGVSDLLAKGSVNPSDLVASNPSGNPSDEGSEPFGEPFAKVPLTTSTSTSTATSDTPNGVGAAKRGTRIPDEFLVTSEMREWAAQETPTVDVDASTRKFVDYWRAESGAKARKVDWVATWRNWLRRDAENSSRRLTPMQRAQQTAAAGRRIAGTNITTLEIE